MSDKIFFEGTEGEKEAEEKFRTYGSTDPFPDIPPALLNSADILRYVTETGMISPFNPSNKLKSATYEIDIIGEIHVWDSSGEKRIYPLKKDGDTYTLAQNSIAFFWTATKFRIPDYIALRFNLRITHVHRGLLLGTGPLIDPGFVGNLLIPLHNLTTRDYVLKKGEGLIWVEFTKLSQNNKWDSSCPRNGKYIEFRADKRNLTAHDYFEKACNNNPILSSITEAVARSQRDAEKASIEAKEARNDAEKAKSTVTFYTIAALIATVIAVGSTLLGLYQIYLQVNGLIQDSISYVKQYRQNQEGMSEKVNQLEARMKQEWQEMQDRLQKLEAENAELRSNLAGKPSPVKPGR